MTAAQRRAIASHRRRLKRRGIARIELRVPVDDVRLVRDVVAALANPESAAVTRTALRRLASGKATGLKALLAAAPLEGIELDRARDTGREVDL